MNDKTCSRCKFWGDTSGYGPDSKQTGMLGCNSDRFHVSYHLPNDDTILVNGALVEGDEGWGFVTGPEFGCIHCEEKEP